MPPGLTGLAQVCLARGASLTARLDATYARERSAALDLSLLLRTVWINLVGKKRGARPLPPALRPTAAEPTVQQARASPGLRPE